MSAPEQHPAVPYDPLLDQPSSPRISGSFNRQLPPPPAGGYTDASPSASPHLHPNQLPPGAATPQFNPSGMATPLPATPGEFGTPRPGYFDSSHRADSVASSTNIRASNYGSMAPLQRDSSYGGYPPSKEGEMGLSGSGRGSDDIKEKQELYAAPRQKTKRKAWIIGGIIGLIVIIIAIAVPVAVLTSKHKGGNGESSNNGSGSSSANGNTNSGNNHQNNFATWGGDGSIVTKDDGTTFTYNNSFGGYWTFDPQNPVNNSARAQSYSPPLSQDWPWGSQNIYGVNLGGWLVLEPFIAPSLYEPFYPNAVDEWTLSTLLMARDGNLNAIEEHYKTFITEEDFAQIAAAGLNWVRIPLPFWAIEVYPGEPFLAKTAWTYFLKAIEWARKYGLRINVDLHAVPGSQNGWNHSGKTGEVDFLNGVMGLANAQRTMDYIRVIAEFISQPEIQPVVPYFGILNEPLSGGGGFPKAAIREFYAEAYRVLREAGNGYGSGKGPYMSIHEAFWGLADWVDFLPGADRIALDLHPYLIFTTLSDTPASAFPPQACNNWAGMVSDSLANFGMTAAGEWSNAINDCGLYVNAVGAGTRYEGTFDGNPVIGSCDPWNDYSTWDDTLKASLKQLGAASMDSLGSWFFWTWKIGPSSATGKIMSPFWSYQLALQEGWAVTDPRTSVGTCAQLGASGVTPVTLKPNQVGTDTNPSVPDLTTYNWPPDTIGGYEGAALVATLPTYTATGPIPTLPTATFASATATPTGNGWNNPADQTLMSVPISGCTYPDPWAAVNAAIPNCAA